MRILSTLIPADGGTATVAGHDVTADPDEVCAVIGVTGQFSAVDNLLTGTEVYVFTLGRHGHGRGHHGPVPDQAISRRRAAGSSRSRRCR